MTLDIFNRINLHSQRMEHNWNILHQGLLGARPDSPNEHFQRLNNTFQAALGRLRDDLNAPTLILATTGTTSSGKSTIVNLLCGADLMPRMAQEMSAGVVYIDHSPEGRRHLQVEATGGALWECGDWPDLSDQQIRDRLTQIMDSFNRNKGANQPETPRITLTYPLACFNNRELLGLGGLPEHTRLRLMDLPGLRNHLDNTNAEVIKHCRDALCLVAYNMEETDENRRRELVNQVLNQVKKMGGSPARMLFVLNRIDVFRKDNDWQRRQAEHIDTVKQEIRTILHEKLPEHRDILEQLSYSPLSSLPALHAQRITADNDRLTAANELNAHFNSLISEEILNDLPRRVDKWPDLDFQRVSESVWQNSHAQQFFANLDLHIQRHFPELVIPTIVQRFEHDVKNAIGEAARTCHSELNSSDEDFKAAEERLYQQNADMRQFFAQAKQELEAIFNDFLVGVKKRPGDSTVLEYLAEDLRATDIYKDLDLDKLTPLFGWMYEIENAIKGVLQAMEQALSRHDEAGFCGTTVQHLPARLQQRLASACDDYRQAQEHNNSARFDGQLTAFVGELNAVINEVVSLQSELENNRIRETIALLMREYLDYLQANIDHQAPEWGLSIGRQVLAELPPPKLQPLRIQSQVVHKSREERIWWTLWLCTRTITWQALPSAYELREQGLRESKERLQGLFAPFHQMLMGYFSKLNEKIAAEHDQVLADFSHKLNQAHQQHQMSHAKTLRHWQPLLQCSAQLNDQLKQLANHWETL